MRFLPQNHSEEAPVLASNDSKDRADPALNTIIPWDTNKSYDVRNVIGRLSDDRSTFFELCKDYAQNIVIGFTRMGGTVAGVVANQPSISSGVLDIDSSVKGARFVRFCNAYSIPIITLVDVPGFLPGRGQEHGGIIRHGAKLLYAYAEANVLKLTVILRKAYGGAYDVMSSRHLGADRVYAWPTAEIAVMGAAGATKILKGGVSLDTSVLTAASRGHVDAIIEPASTRARLIRDLEAYRRPAFTYGQRKHGNVPL